MIAADAAEFFFGKSATWTSLTEVRLNDDGGQSAGNIDVVLVHYDPSGKVLDFGSLEIQAVYVSGNVTKPFKYFMERPDVRGAFTWPEKSVPRPDYLSSSRKRLAPQLLFKGGIFQAWRKKQAVALQSSFFATLPKLPTVDKTKAEVMWNLYDLVEDRTSSAFHLTLTKSIYTLFDESLGAITKPEPGKIEDFTAALQRKLDEKKSVPPDASRLIAPEGLMGPQS